MDSFTSDFRKQMERYEQELRDLNTRSAIVPPVAQPTTVAPSDRTAPHAFTAPLVVRVTSAGGAIPIADALVVVTRDQNGETIIEGSRITDQSGLTEPLVLSAVDPSLTLSPGTVIPSILYDVSVAAPDHYRTRVSRIPLYGGIPTELPVSLVPLPEFAEQDDRELRYDMPPIDL